MKVKSPFNRKTYIDSQQNGEQMSHREVKLLWIN